MTIAEGAFAPADGTASPRADVVNVRQHARRELAALGEPLEDARNPNPHCLEDDLSAFKNWPRDPLTALFRCPPMNCRRGQRKTPAKALLKRLRLDV